MSLLAAFGKELTTDTRKIKFQTKISLLIVVILAFAILYTLVNGPDDWNLPSNASMTLGSSIYFSTVSICTVGYGDITPRSSRARALVILEILVGFMIAIL